MPEATLGASERCKAVACAAKRPAFNLLKPVSWKLRQEKTGEGLSAAMVSKGKKTVALPAVVDLDSLDGIRDGLIDVIEEGPVAVDAAGVERVSTNAVFMLLSAAQTARRNNFEFAIDRPSAALTAAIGRLGLGAQFSGMMRG